MQRNNMDLTQCFKSVIDQDRAPVVLCDLDHTIRYMNPAALVNYAKRGGKALLGSNLLDCHGQQSREMIKRIVSWFAKSPDNNIVYEAHNSKYNKDLYMVALRNDDGTLIGYYEKHEYRSGETMSFYDMPECLDA